MFKINNGEDVKNILDAWNRALEFESVLFRLSMTFAFSVKGIHFSSHAKMFAAYSIIIFQ